MSFAPRQKLLGLTLAVAACSAGTAFAQKKGEAAPPLAKWAEEAKGKTGAFPHVVAIVTALPEKGKGEPKFLNLDAAAFNKLSYFQLPNQASAAWDMKLNAAKFAELDSIDVVLQTTRADTVLLASDKGDWTFFRSDKGKRVALHKAKGPGSTKPEAIAAWIPTALGWDGVVIDQKGDFLLVGSTAAILGAGQIQALAVGDSINKFSLKADERKGAGLLSLSENKDGVAVFDIVFLGQGVKDLPTGTKLIIEKKK